MLCNLATKPRYLVAAGGCYVLRPYQPRGEASHVALDVLKRVEDMLLESYVLLHLWLPM